MREVPEDAEEVAVAAVAEAIECFGMWRGKDGTIYISGYHFGPSGEVLFIINPDGSVEHN